jgi:hypothetical protein
MITKRFVLLALLSACAGFANTMIVTGVDSALGLQDSLWIKDSGTDQQLYFAGGVDIEVDGYKRVVFCVDLLTSINVPGTYTTTMDFSDTPYIRAGDLSDVPSLQRVGWLLQNEFPTTKIGGAALQLAIWDIVTDHGNGFDTGTVAQSTTHPTDALVLADAIQYEADSAPYISTAGIVYHNTSGNVAVQTLMGASATDGGPSPTPEPAAMILTLGGLALIGLSRLRRSRPR